MNKGSTRVTVRLGDDLIELIDEALAIRNERAVLLDNWNRSDFIVKAIEEKLNHLHRASRREIKVSVNKIGEYIPREVEVDQ